MANHISLIAQTRTDSLAIEQAGKDYVEGWATGNLDRIRKAVSPELVKRIVSSDTEGLSYISDMSASLLLMAAKANIGGVDKRVPDFEPDKEFKVKVTIHDISGPNAMIKVVNTKYGFFDYCHLSKVNKEWKIINVLWDWLPKDE